MFIGMSYRPADLLSDTAIGPQSRSAELLAKASTLTENLLMCREGIGNCRNGGTLSFRSVPRRGERQIADTGMEGHVVTFSVAGLFADRGAP
jgi:hypothetical protein